MLFSSLVLFWYTVEVLAEIWSSVTHAHKGWGWSSHVYTLSLALQGHACGEWHEHHLHSQTSPEAHCDSSRGTGRTDSSHVLYLGTIFLQSFDKATGKCIFPMDGFFVSLRSEIVISSQTESHTHKNSHRRLWENLCFLRDLKRAC